MHPAAADFGLGTKLHPWGEVPQVKPLMGRGSLGLCDPFESTGKKILSCQAHGEEWVRENSFRSQSSNSFLFLSENNTFNSAAREPTSANFLVHQWWGGWGEQVIQMTMLAVEVVSAWEAFVLCPLSAGPEGGEILWPASLTYTPVWILFEARRAEIS